MVLMRKEAALQGLTDVKVWDCGVGCYDKQFLQQRRRRRRGPVRRHALPALPQQGGPEGEPDDRQLREVHGADKVASFGAYAWAAGIAFRDAVNAAGEGRRRQQRHPQDDLRAAEQDPQVRRRRDVRPDRPRGPRHLELQRDDAGQERRVRAGQPDQGRARSSAGRTGSSTGSSTSSAPEPDPSHSGDRPTVPPPRAGAPSRSGPVPCRAGVGRSMLPTET